jgi:two-component system, OmpR family, phosphate regulon sensor histidine kinase PhoR
MNTILFVVLALSLVFNAALVFFCLSYKKDICRLKTRLSDVRSSGMRRRLHFGHGKKSLAEISTALNGLMDDFQNILETKQKLELSHKQLIANISHDIRTPLTSLTGYLEVLREQNLTAEERGEYLEVVYRKARLMHRMIEEFFELSRLESGDVSLALAPMDACESVRELLAACYQDFVSASVTPEVTLPDAPVRVIGNRAAMERVLSNLLFNALKHGGSGGKISVSLREDEAFAVIAVADTGKGIAPDDLPYVFDRLYTADKARTAMERGTGLGLAIAKQLTEMQNGTIAVQSTPGMKTVFTVTLRKAQTQA